MLNWFEKLDKEAEYFNLEDQIQETTDPEELQRLQEQQNTLYDELAADDKQRPQP